MSGTTGERCAQSWRQRYDQMQRLGVTKAIWVGPEVSAARSHSVNGTTRRDVSVWPRLYEWDHRWALRAIMASTVRPDATFRCDQGYMSGTRGERCAQSWRQRYDQTQRLGVTKAIWVGPEVSAARSHSVNGTTRRDVSVWPRLYEWDQRWALRAIMASTVRPDATFRCDQGYMSGTRRERCAQSWRQRCDQGYMSVTRGERCAQSWCQRYDQTRRFGVNKVLSVWPDDLFAWFLTYFPTTDDGFDYPNDLCVQNALWRRLDAIEILQIRLDYIIYPLFPPPHRPFYWSFIITSLYYTVKKNLGWKESIL